MSETIASPVRLERVSAHVAMLVLNRPQARNAITAEMAELIERYVIEAENDPAIRAVVFASEGPSFCAGADLKEVAAGRGMQLSRPDSGFAGFVFGKRIKPWIAAVQGAAHGGGTEIALACDMVVASDDASFGLTEVRRGLIAGAGGCIRLARVLPRPIMLEMITTGVPIDAERALALGLINRVVSADAIRQTAIDMAELIAANSPISVRESLRLARAAVDLMDKELTVLQNEVVATVMSGPDVVEGATAFIEKRAPQWRS